VPLAALRPLRHRNFALVFYSGLISNIGSWMQTIAVGSLVTARTGKASWAAFVAVAAFLPIGILSPIGGALADRLDRRRFMIASNCVDAVQSLVLAGLYMTHHASSLTVTLLTLVEGCITALRIPFYQAMIPDLVERDDLLAAASLGSTQYNAGRIVGPAFAGIVIAVWDFTAVFVIDAISFLAVIFAMVVIKLPPQPKAPEGETTWQRIRAGGRAAWAEPGCRAAITLISLTALFVSPFIALIPARALQLGGDHPTKKLVAGITAALTTAQGVGAVVGALLLASLALRFGRRRLLVFDLVATPVALSLYAYAPNRTTAVIALALMGSLYIGLLSGLNTVVQLRAPIEYRGRILSLYFVALGTVYPIGGLIQGPLADRFGLARVTTTGGALLVLSIALIAAFRPHILRALDDRPVEHPVPLEASAAEARTERTT
jgi:MFS family permease